VPEAIGLTRGGRAWARRTMILRGLLGPRLCRAATFPQNGFEFLMERLADPQVSLLTYSEPDDAGDVIDPYGETTRCRCRTLPLL
jgi:hypothetical protein